MPPRPSSPSSSKPGTSSTAGRWIVDGSPENDSISDRSAPWSVSSMRISLGGLSGSGGGGTSEADSAGGQVSARLGSRGRGGSGGSTSEVERDGSTGVVIGSLRGGAAPRQYNPIPERGREPGPGTNAPARVPFVSCGGRLASAPGRARGGRPAHGFDPEAVAGGQPRGRIHAGRGTSGQR